MHNPATDLLQRQHRQMKRRRERFEVHLSDLQCEGLVPLARTFAHIQGHLAGLFRKEEGVYYPALAPPGAVYPREEAAHRLV